MSLQLLNSAGRLITDVDPVIINLCEQLGLKHAGFTVDMIIYI